MPRDPVIFDLIIYIFICLHFVSLQSLTNCSVISSRSNSLQSGSKNILKAAEHVTGFSRVRSFPCLYLSTGSPGRAASFYTACTHCGNCSLETIFPAASPGIRRAQMWLSMYTSPRPTPPREGMWARQMHLSPCNGCSISIRTAPPDMYHYIGGWPGNIVLRLTPRQAANRPRGCPPCAPDNFSSRPIDLAVY